MCRKVLKMSDKSIAKMLQKSHKEFTISFLKDPSV
jgi:hypothetical protein